jgi:hypothetical protein
MSSSVRQTVLPFKLEMMKEEDQLTSLGGLPLVHELYRKLGLPRLIEQHVQVKDKGWTESELIESIVALSIAGGEHLSDVEITLADKGYQKVIGKDRLPSAKALERFLKRFHEEQLMTHRPPPGTSWVPEESAALAGLEAVNQEVARKLIAKSGLATVTIENDAMVVFSEKEECLGTYKGGTGYMPVLGTIAELGIVICDEFRDGNVTPDFAAKRFFKSCLAMLPESVQHVRTRLDGAYYQHDLIDLLEERHVEFTITGEKRKGMLTWIEALPEAEWKPLMKITEHGVIASGREWTELAWVSANGSQEQMRKRTHRYLVTRRTEEQWELYQSEAIEEVTLKERYEVIVTNMDWEGDRLIRWHYERGGTIEHVNKQIKSDVAGGTLPCGEFGANAAWWRIQCLAYNLVRALQLHALPAEFSRCRLKRLRLWLFNIAGRVIESGRQVILKLAGGHPSFEMYREARSRIACLAMS